MAIHGSCLCGDVAWTIDGVLEQMTHCHCARCRKTHGAPFATYGLAPSSSFRLVRGEAGIVRYRAAAGLSRPFCGRCGSVVADGSEWGTLAGTPIGPLDDDPGTRPLAHIFVASKAPWVELDGELPRFQAYPPGVPMAVQPSPAREPAPAGAIAHGSCLCGAVTFAVMGTPIRSLNCHCTRCRKARAAAHASNLIVPADGVRFLRGDDQLVTYKVPEARFFSQTFCRTCGGKMPRIDPSRGIAIVPLGALDGDTPLRPQRHIFAASKAPWFRITDTLPQDDEYPPGM